MTDRVLNTPCWQHAYGDVSPVAELAFDGGTPFDVEGMPIARNAAVVKTGIAVNIGSNISVGAAYTGQLGENARDHGIAADMVVKF